jgi:hypothetical protein
MKRNRPLCSFIVFMLLIQYIAHAQTNPQYRLKRLLSISYDTTGNAKDTIQNEYHNYNALNEDTIVNDSAIRQTQIINYDASKRKTMMLTQYKPNKTGSWVNELRESHIYKGHLDSQVVESYQNGAWLISGNTSMYKNQQNLDSLIIYRTYISGVLSSTDGFNYFYNNDGKMQLLLYWYIDANKKVVYEKDSSVFNTAGDQVTLLKFSLPSDSLMERLENTYNQNHLLASYSDYYWDNSSRNFVLSTKSARIYNAKNKETADSTFYYNSTTKSWNAFIILTNYDNNDNISSVTYLFSIDGKPGKYSKQVVYYFFETYPSGIHQDAIASQVVHCYPVPADNRITIEIPGKSGSFKIDLYDMSGRPVCSQRNSMVQGDKTELDISALPQGYYTGTLIKDGGGEYIFKVVK